MGYGGHYSTELLIRLKGHNEANSINWLSCSGIYMWVPPMLSPIKKTMRWDHTGIHICTLEPVDTTPGFNFEPLDWNVRCYNLSILLEE